MTKYFLALAATIVTASANAAVYVPYNSWTYLPNCGGYTRLTCPDVENAREKNQCRIEFSGSYNCSQVKLYVGYDFHPTSKTNVMPMSGSFYVDNSKVGAFTDSFRVFMNSGEGTAYEQVTYQFNY